MPEQFYRDRGDPEIAKLAQAICRARGQDPFSQVPDSGYSGAPLIPAWWKEQDAALAFRACWRVMNAEGGGSA